MLPAIGDAAFVCACHGSEFHGDGRVLAGPATQPLPSVATSLDGGDALVDLGTPTSRDSRIS
jgi:Rieske Fe-S protein